MSSKIDSEEKRVNRGIVVTSVLLLIVVGSVVGFIFHIRGQHNNRQEHMAEIIKEVAVQDSLNRINAKRIEKEERAESERQKAKEAEEKAMEAYVDKLVEKELKNLEEPQTQQDAEAEPNANEDEFWDENVEKQPQQETQSEIEEDFQ